jgi:hypothetical protein
MMAPKNANMLLLSIKSMIVENGRDRVFFRKPAIVRKSNASSECDQEVITAED